MVAYVDFVQERRAKESKLADTAETYSVDYRLDKETKQLVVAINGESPDKAPRELLENIVQKDRFLRCYSVEQVQNGSLDMKQADGVQAVPKEYDPKANVVERVEAEVKKQGLTLR